MKKLVSIVGATLLLAGCGSQNLAPLEEKTTDLREDKNLINKLVILNLKLKGLKRIKKTVKKLHLIIRKLN